MVMKHEINAIAVQGKMKTILEAIKKGT